MLGMMGSAIPRLLVDRVRGARGLTGEILATDEVFRRMTMGIPFRTAYRTVSAELKQGVKMPDLTPAEIVARRKVVGGMGNLAIADARKRLSAGRRWNGKMRRRWEGALAELAGEAR